MLPQSAVSTGTETYQALKAIFIADWEQEFITKLLHTHEGNISKSAQAAGMDRRGLQRLIQKGKPDAPDSLP